MLAEKELAIGLNAVAVSSNGDLVATGGQNGTLTLWDAKGQALTRKQSLSIGHPIYSLAFSPNARLLACGVGDWKLRVLDLTGETMASRFVISTQGGARGVTFSPDNRLFVCGLEGSGLIQFFDAVSGTLKRSVRQLGNGVGTVAFVPRSNLFVNGGQQLFVWDGDALDLQSSRTETRVPEQVELDRREQSWVKHRLSGWTLSLACFPDGKGLVAAGAVDREDQGMPLSVAVWDLQTGKRQRFLDRSGVRYTSVAVSTDGKWVAAGNEVGEIRIWDASSGQLKRTLDASEKAVRELVFLPGKPVLVSVGDEGRIGKWNA